jgi:hypothetical protein
MNDARAHETVTLPAHAARLLAIEVLLADPEALQNDALEGDLYILRDRLRQEGQPDVVAQASDAGALQPLPKEASSRRVACWDFIVYRR